MRNIARSRTSFDRLITEYGRRGALDEQQPLLAALGAITARAAWSAVDTGAHEAARSLFRLALFCATRASDPQLRAHVLADAAAHHNHLGYHDDALDLVRIVEGDERVAGPVRMVVHGVKARVYAAAGETKACQRHLPLAEDAHADPSPTEPAWLATLQNPGHLHAMTGHTLATLTKHGDAIGDQAEAVRRLTAAVEAFDPDQHGRAVGLCRARLAALHLTTGELDAGRWWTQQALQSLTVVRSARLARALGTVRRAAAHLDNDHMSALASDIDAALTIAGQPHSG